MELKQLIKAMTILAKYGDRQVRRSHGHSETNFAQVVVLHDVYPDEVSKAHKELLDGLEVKWDIHLAAWYFELPFGDV